LTVFTKKLSKILDNLIRSKDYRNSSSMKFSNKPDEQQINLDQKRKEIDTMMEELKLQISALDIEAKIMKGEETKFNINDEYKDDMREYEMTDLQFSSQFGPDEMRCLALVAHNHMKPAMKSFVVDNKNVLKKFRLTGTNTTMTMLHEVFKDDKSIQYGPTCQSGPLGGDAELVALMCMEDLGGMIFFQDPMYAHPHQADIDCLNRQALVHDVLFVNNPTSAYAVTAAFRLALRKGSKGIISSFFHTKRSPCVAEYKRRQESTQQENVDSNFTVTHQQAFSNDGLTSYEPNFYSKFRPEEMRSIALVAHNHMKPSMHHFIYKNRNILKKFRLIGTIETMSMMKDVFKDEPFVHYGPTCETGPLGGNAQLCALMCMEDLGGIIYFQDPLDTHCHQADINCLNRQSNVHDIYVAYNMTSSNTMMKVLQQSLKKGNRARISSFFGTKVSPSVLEYKRRQAQILDSARKLTNP